MKQVKMSESYCAHSLDEIRENHARHRPCKTPSVRFTSNVHQVHGMYIKKCTCTLDSCKEYQKSLVGAHALK